ncbi:MULTISPECIES: hypothetical protein [Streptomyces]|uniref:Uncharacterized protein n=1 Tax=Streptomyces ramulosus TaxID=47762 RepID=A0ABW1FN81_9ACTN
MPDGTALGPTAQCTEAHWRLLQPMNKASQENHKRKGGLVAKRILKAATGAALSVFCVACTTQGGGSPSPTNSPAKYTPVNQLKSINLEGDPLSVTEISGAHESPKGVGEVRAGIYRIIPYTEENSCGLLVTDAKAPERPFINLVSKWPHSDSEGSRRYAAGPYNFTSGSGANGSHSHASIYCSKSAMVIEFRSAENVMTSGRQGHISLKKRHSNAEPVIVIAGSDDARKTVAAFPSCGVMTGAEREPGAPYC